MFTTSTSFTPHLFLLGWLKLNLNLLLDLMQVPRNLLYVATIVFCLFIRLFGSHVIKSKYFKFSVNYFQKKMVNQKIVSSVLPFDELRLV